MAYICEESLDKPVKIYRYGGRYADNKDIKLYLKQTPDHTVKWTTNADKAITFCYRSTADRWLGRLRLYSNFKFFTE
jgi:hypothetical protein